MESKTKQTKRVTLGPGETAGLGTAREYFGDLPGLRVGFWGHKPRDGERLVGTLSVRASDPDIPVFCADDDDV